MPKRRSARAPRQFSPSSPSRRCPRAAAGLARRSSTPANKSLRADRGQEAGVRGIPSPFINLDERGRDTPHPSLLPLVPMRKDFLGEILEAPDDWAPRAEQLVLNRPVTPLFGVRRSLRLDRYVVMDRTNAVGIFGNHCCQVDCI